MSCCSKLFEVHMLLNKYMIFKNLLSSTQKQSRCERERETGAEEGMPLNQVVWEGL